MHIVEWPATKLTVLILSIPTFRSDKVMNFWWLTISDKAILSKQIRFLLLTVNYNKCGQSGLMQSTLCTCFISCCFQYTWCMLFILALFDHIFMGHTHTYIHRDLKWYTRTHIQSHIHWLVHFVFTHLILVCITFVKRRLLWYFWPNPTFIANSLYLVWDKTFSAMY